MNEPETRGYELYQDAKGDYRVKVDAPGIAAVSAKFEPADLVARLSKLTGLDIRLGDNPKVG